MFSLPLGTPRQIELFFIALFVYLLGLYSTSERKHAVFGFRTWLISLKIISIAIHFSAKDKISFFIVAESNSIENSCFSNLQIKRKLCSDTDYQEITTWFLFHWNFRFHKLRWVKEHVWSEIFLCEINNSHTPLLAVTELRTSSWALGPLACMYHWSIVCQHPSKCTGRIFAEAIDALLQGRCQDAPGLSV